MYRVKGHDGSSYEAPSLATLQQWVQEGRIIPTTVVEDLLSGTEGPASGIEGLRFLRPVDPVVDSASEYPRVSPAAPGCDMHIPLVVAILATLCFGPLGVVAVVYAAKIPQLIEIGDLPKAKRYARIAVRVSILSFILGILFTSLLLKFNPAFGLPQ